LVASRNVDKLMIGSTGGDQMHGTDDRCGPTARAVYRGDGRGELYLCKHRAQVGGAHGARLDRLARRRARTRSAS
jgi:hypothetical protein